MSQQADKRQSRRAYLAQVLILVDAREDSEASGIVSEHLTRHGVRAEGTGILDWSYSFADEKYQHPVRVQISAAYERDPGDLRQLAFQKRLLRGADGVLREALAELVEAAWALDAAIDGVTDQFDDEIADLQRALRKAVRARRSLAGDAS
jgi:hypothetical protein